MDPTEILERYSEKLTKDINSFKKYNWVDVQPYAEFAFYNYAYEIPWAEDMWNILMFNAVVDSSLVAPSNIAENDLGDILVWLLAMQDLFYDYKICIDHESVYRPQIIEYINDFDSEDCIREYIQSSFSEWIQNSDYNFGDAFLEVIFGEELGFSFEDIKNDLLEINIELRRDCIIRAIQKHFKSTIEIMMFMAGYHYCEHYGKLEEKILDIEGEYKAEIDGLKEKLAQATDDNEISELKYELANIEEEIEERIRDLINDEPISLLGLDHMENLSYEEAFFGALPCTYNWVEEGMSRQ